MTQPLDTISGALLDIGARASGEQPDVTVANDALAMLNLMLDMWSTQKLFVFAIQETIHPLTGGLQTYTIGSPTSNVTANVTATFTSGGVMTVSALNSGAISNGMQIFAGGSIPSGLVLTGYGTGLGGSTAAALGTYYINNNTFALGTGSASLYAPRPLRINSAFVRVVNSITGVLDYPVSVISSEQWELIGIKTLPGPWPKAVYYNPQLPNGVLNYWPNPSSGEMHLMCDSLLTTFGSLSDNVVLPQGYGMAMRWGLGELLMPQFGKKDPTTVQMVMKNAKTAAGMIKRLNSQPPVPARFDLPIRNQGNNAGWIMDGGFGR